MPWRGPCVPYFEGWVVGNSPLGGMQGEIKSTSKGRDRQPPLAGTSPCIPLWGGWSGNVAERKRRTYFPFPQLSMDSFRFRSCLMSFESEMRYLIFSGKPAAGMILEFLIPALSHFDVSEGSSSCPSSLFIFFMNIFGKRFTNPMTNAVGL